MLIVERTSQTQSNVEQPHNILFVCVYKCFTYSGLFVLPFFFLDVASKTKRQSLQKHPQESHEMRLSSVKIIVVTAINNVS